MLVSDDGEAANAGRAVGQLSRRLGLSGGDLKELFLTGSLSGGRKPPAASPDAQAEIANLKRNLRRLENVVRNLQDERDQLVVEAGTARLAFHRSRANRRMAWGIAGIGVVLVLAVVGVSVAVLDIDLAPRPPRPPTAALGQPGSGSMAVVRSARGTLYSEPDKQSPPVSFVAAGTRMPVKRLIWNLMLQWAEVDLDGKTAYVPTTEIDLL